MNPPDDLLSRPLLRQMAGEDAFRIGEKYFDEGRVRQIQVAPERITAKVSGSRAYRVKLWRGRGELQFSCNCAAGRDGAFCKHCAAVGLAWLAGPENQTGAPGVTRDELREHLRGLEKERLVSLALEAMDYDDILRRRLMLETIGVARTRRAASASGGPPDLATYRQLLREAIESPDYVDYDAMPDYAQGVEEAIRPLGDLLRAGHAAAVMELAELALIELDKASEMIDGGDGSLNAVYDDLQQYHLEACRRANPDPERLAARLLAYEIEGGLGVFNNSLSVYADVLGSRGQAAWRRMLMEEWESLPALAAPKPGKTGRRSINHRRFQISTLMERLAAAEGNIDLLLAVKQHDLSSAHDYLSLAELCASLGRPGEAVDWAEHGLRIYPAAAADAGLRDFLAGAYQSAGRHEEAAALAWEDFAAAPNLENFRRLRDFAQPGGKWMRWRERAFTHLRALPAAPDRSTLVEILLAENREDEAWAEAHAGGVRPHLWLRLAECREKLHPGDALRIYQDQLGPIIARGDQRAYREAIALIGKIRALLEQLGRATEFGAFSADVRAANRQRRNFLKLLDTLR